MDKRPDASTFGHYQDSYTPVLSWGDLLVRGAVEVPERDVFVFPDTRRTYLSMTERSTEVARSLRAMGVGPGDHVGILMPNCIEFLEVWFAISFLGAVCVPINARFKARELGYVIENGDLVALLTSDIVEQHTDYVDLLHEALPGLSTASDPLDLHLEAAPRLRGAVMMGGSSRAGFCNRARFEALASRVEPAEVHELRRRVAIRDTAVIFYTSGTTSMPKGCLLDHETLFRVGYNTGLRMELQNGCRMFDPLPLFHTAATQPMVAVLEARGTYISMTHFEAGAALELIRSERVTSMFTAFPIIAQALLNHESSSPSDLGDVAVTFNVAPPDALIAMQERMPSTVQVTGFGMTETGGSVVLTSPSEPVETRLASEGAHFPGMEIVIKDVESGKRLAAGERGEICIRGPQVFKGYFKAPEKNAESFDAEGFFLTGDLGMLDDEGRLHYLGRAKDMLKVGGENVAAIEIESFLSTHPAVSIAQVVGVPDDRYVEVPAAFIELKPGHTATEEEIIAFCDGEMARFKVPRYVRFVSEWPMSATKVQKFKLRDVIVAEWAS